MKKVLLTTFVELEKEELQHLCSIVAETLATEVVIPKAEPKRKSYGINDLWSLRRNMKTAGRSWNGRSTNFIIRG